ncbi:MAG TPA: alpha-L-fucosidase [Candidatus Lokiarchaeia archaeon]|nr:alpha-L-fucosidase [Candidatus Lokiarchaeia archaeon]
MPQFRGTLYKDDNDKLVFKHTPLFPWKSNLAIDVPVDEFLEDIIGKDIEISIEPRKSGTPIYPEINEMVAPETEVDPDYEHAPPEAYEHFQDRKFGMRVHWGPYSVLGLDASWPVANDECSSEFIKIYYTLYEMFNPTEFNADEWARFAERAGFRFMVITAKHCDGFAMFDTKTTVKALRRLGRGGPGIGNFIEEVEIPYSIMDTRFKRDIVGELAQAFHKQGIGFGVYYSWWEWNDPNARWDKRNRSFDPTYSAESHPEEWQAFIDRERLQLKELCSEYGPLDEISFDVSWFGMSWSEMKDIIKMCRQLQPNCMFRNRGLGPYGDYQTPEHWVPAEPGTGDSRVITSTWQVINTFGTAWAYQPFDKYMAREDVLAMLIDVVAKGGSLMMGISPMPNGLFPPETIEAMEWIGQWLVVNGEAIYETRPWNHYNEGESIKFTRSKDSRHVYLIHVGWAGDVIGSKLLHAVPGSTIQMLGVEEPLSWHQDESMLEIFIPEELAGNKPCEFAYCFRVEVEEKRENEAS